MSLLATYNFDPQIYDALTEAFERAGINPQTIGEDHIDACARSMRYMLNSEWSTLGIRQWMIEQAQQTTTVGMSSFNLPAGGVNIIQAVLHRNSRDTIMNPISRSDYLGIADKLLNGRPDRYWQDRQKNLTTVTIWRRGENTTDTIIYNYFRRLTDTGALKNTLDMPVHMYDAFCDGLAWRLAVKFSPARVGLLRGMYWGDDPNSSRPKGGSLMRALTEDREKVDTYITIRRSRR